MAATLMNRMEALTEAQRVYAEQSLRYRTLLQTASDGIHVVEPSGKLVEASDSFYTMLGYPVGKPLNISEWDAQWTPDELREVVMRLIAHPELLETRHRRSDGSIIDVEISAHGIEIGGEPLLYASSRNITERKEAERLLQNFAAEQQRMLAELQIAIAAAQASSQAKSQFLGNISHELRTPLNGVQGMTQLLGLTEQTEEQREYTAQILHSTHDLLRVINEMLDFSMMETGRLTVKSEPFDLQTLMLATFEPLEQRATEKKLDFQLDIDPELPGLLIGDATRLKQVLSNLVDNAIKFTERGNVSVRLAVASVQGERLTLRGEVRDSGIGIPANRLGELFTPFTQIDASTTRRFGGTGLGLSITKRLLELMGGDIGVESQEGQGSLFWFHVDCQRLQE
jgi:PAS domain S-box-containing protein